MSKPELIKEIKNEITQNGPIPFVRFMAQALYHPKYGYYTGSGDKIGWKGDFYTSSTVHPVFGELLAKQCIQMKDEIGDVPLTIVEAGAGKGTLCQDILTLLSKEYPDVFKHCQYIIIESSPFFKELQQKRLCSTFSDHVSWASSIPQNLKGILFSNELLDAFPVHRLRVEKENIQEIFVDWQENRFVEILQPPSTPKLLSYLNRLGVSYKQSAELEINLKALDWMTEAGKALLKGFVITIDYGYPASQLYSPRRAKGTFLCYQKHQSNENPYTRIGEQDMTAHIDFTSLADQGKKVQLDPIGFTDQMHFLMGLGIAQRMEGPAKNMFESEEAKKEFLAMKHLMDPAGMGQTFKVLVQAKNITARQALDGLQYNALSLLNQA